MTPIFVTRDIFDREGMTGRLSGMALDINTTSLNGCPPDNIVNIPVKENQLGDAKDDETNSSSSTVVPRTLLSGSSLAGEQRPPATSSRTKHSARPGYCRLKRVRLGTGQTVPQSYVDSRVCSWFVNKGWERRMSCYNVVTSIPKLSRKSVFGNCHVPFRVSAETGTFQPRLKAQMAAESMHTWLLVNPSWWLYSCMQDTEQLNWSVL
ncbi:predicted protein [Histoplasma capsulatum G186AR]|uniref:Uncharacterized protein n=1 Tax=Ajellomyces capsulatus (strain G186AR / H82 / ATCC MYA-2454 / RMSCC 2432) TaxID=447093 RepID=C0NQ58_AJECG|nr:uncharacterized protein HCBG_05646 [Histoplasma capsulatum G186AR]EEH06330.1 predicted protein [Histoplasma capsulatum G186AR]